MHLIDPKQVSNLAQTQWFWQVHAVNEDLSESSSPELV